MSSQATPFSKPSAARAGDVPRERRLFVNRNLRLDTIEMVGFDMDHTLAVYRQDAIERLSIECTIGKLIEKKSYPRAIRHLDYDRLFPIRGICVDKKHGNLFKMDRYNHVGRVLHGRRVLGKEERRSLYRQTTVRVRPPRYAWIDSLFALPEATMYARLVEYFDKSPSGGPSYVQLWTDVRECIDEAHRDNSMKSVIKRNLGDFIEQDSEMAATLHKFRSAGRRIFLLTNSEWHYTDAVMSYLLNSAKSNYPNWRNYFDYIVVASQKPAFFTGQNPFVELDEKGEQAGEVKSLSRGRIYQGGNITAFEGHVGVRGDRILYVGDHIYGDILRSKKSSLWRTALVVRELEAEIRRMDVMRDRIELLEELEDRRSRLDAEVAEQQGRLRAIQREDSKASEAGKRSEKENLDRLRVELRQTIARADDLAEEVDAAFHPWWGPVYKEGNENSKFGDQVEDYACIYTGRASNFLLYSPVAYLRSPRDYMPHETF